MAQRLQNKRSSIAGRRPDSTYLEPGELAVNTNSTDPGLFFEGNDGSTVKVGPTAMGATKPATDIPYGNGEEWFNVQGKQLNLYNASLEEWQTVLSPVYGGSEFLVFVGSEFPAATDALGNDGSAAPFASFNRAVIEVAKRSILQQRDDSPKQNKYTIILLPGTNIARNEPGVSLIDFVTTFTPLTATQELTSEELRQFNSVDGGVVLPRGTSIVGIDSFKSVIRPTYVPEWTADLYAEHIDSTATYTLPAVTSIFYATGESLIERATFTDKEDTLEVIGIEGEKEEVGVLETLSPHGLQTLVLNDTKDEWIRGDIVTLTYPSAVARVNGVEESIPEGLYYAEPLTETKLQLRRISDLSVVFRSEFPGAPVPGSTPDDFFTLTIDLKTHHRLSCISFAPETALNDFYVKVQKAYSQLIFGDAVDNGEVTSAEINIGAVLTTSPTPVVDNTYIRPVSVNQININSNFGLCGIDADGGIVGGLKQLNCFGMNYRAFNNDSEVYEVYYDQTWIPLTEATWRGLGILPGQVTNSMALQYMIDSVQLDNFRYFLRPTMGVSNNATVSTGIIDSDSDTQHYGLLARNGATIQASDQKSAGAAIGFWAKDGGVVWVETASSFLGDSSIKSDGFRGIGTIGGAAANQKGFEIIGVRRPSSLSVLELSKETNKQIIHINSTIQAATATTLTFADPVNVNVLLPYSLRPGSVIWVKDVLSGTAFSATIAAGGLDLDNLTLNVEPAGNTINGTNLAELSVPYLRRFLDPRDLTQRSYYLQVRNTTETHAPPATGQVLRFAENQGAAVIPLLEPGKQLDPGENGGWNHIFVVHQATSREEGNNLNTLTDWDDIPNRSDSYYVSLQLGDASGPHVSSVEYAKGAYSTRSLRSYVATHSDVDGSLDILPSEDKSQWSVSRRFDFIQPVEETYTSTGFLRAVDPELANYPAGSVYLRGASVSDERYDDFPVLDFDDGTADYGLADPVNPSLVNQTLIDPSYSHGRQAVARFLTLLGYEQAKVDSVLSPQLWSNRDLTIASFPALDGGGYAVSIGNWPVEFCDPSSVQATNFMWRRPGFHNVSKGLEAYQSSTLNREMRFDSMRTSSFGGRVDVEGRNSFNETLPLEINSERRTNDIF